MWKMSLVLNPSVNNVFCFTIWKKPNRFVY